MKRPVNPSMVFHSLTLTKEVVNHLNASQTTVATADQPIYALSKQAQ